MSAHRYWRIANLKVAGNKGFIAAEVVFYNKQYQDFTVGGTAISSRGNPNDVRSDPARLFDKDNSTNFLNDYENMPLSQAWAGYISPEPQELQSVGLLMRQDMLISGDMWQTADIEYSDDGINWFFYGQIFPRFGTTAIDTTLRVFFVVSADLIGISKGVVTQSFNVYSRDESGSLSGVVTQGLSGANKVPVKAEVALHDRLTHSLLQITWSDADGLYQFTGLDSKREYYVSALHPTKFFNAVIQDGLKSGMAS